MLQQAEMNIYEKQINIPLLNEVLSFVAETAGANGTQRSELHRRCIFYYYSQDWRGAVQRKYGFLYLGELLERYEERFTMPITDLRAIALALGYTNRLQKDAMFVGNQKTAFLQNVRRLAMDDVYLTGALYLLSEGTSDSTAYRTALLNTAHTKTEELLFVLSLFPSAEGLFPVLKEQLLHLLGAGRTMPVLGNAQVFNWLICHLQPVLKNIRGKDMSLFKAMDALPSSYVKAGSRHHEVLLQSGYTSLDIAYLNTMAVQYRATSDALQTNSIVTEKIIVSLFNEALGSKDGFEPTVYEQLSQLFKQYKTFSIKCYGVSTLDAALAPDLHIQNCDTFLWLTDHLSLEHWLFRVFDILDASWDALAGKIGSDSYRSLFDGHLSKKMDADEIRSRIQRFDHLTGSSYLDGYYDTRWGGHFDLFVEKGIFDLWQVFQNSIDKDGAIVKHDMLSRIKGALFKLPSIQAFRFYERFLPKYGFDGLTKYFSKDHSSLTFSDGLIEWFSYSKKTSVNLHMMRDFLSDEEQKTLLLWLEDYLFFYKPETYLPFIKEILLHPQLSLLFPREDLRALFDLIIGQQELLGYHDERRLKELYLTEEEKTAEELAKELAEQEKERKRKTDLEQQLQKQYQTKFDGTIRSMESFIERCEHNEENHLISCRIVYSNLNQLLTEKEFVLDRQESAQLLLLCSRLVNRSIMCLPEAQNMISNVKEAPTHAAQSNDSNC